MGLVQKAFSDIITFSRSSNATRVGPDGLIQYAPHNLILQSQTFDNASWTKTRSSITANSIAAPDGTVTADKLVEDTTASNTHQALQAATLVNGATYTLSVYAKSAERSRIWLRATGTGEFAAAYFDLSSGTVVSGTGLIQSVGNGWYRCSVTGISDVSGSGNQLIYLVNTGTNISYTGDGTSGLYLWGAQLAVGPLALDYTPTTSAAVYGPRFDFDGSGVTSVDPIATNLLLQSGFAGAVAGTPGTPPTSWSFAFNTGSLAAVADYQGIGNSLTFTASGTRIVVSQSVSVLANATYALSVKVLSSNVQALQTVLFNPLPAGATVTGPYVNNVLRAGSYVPAENETLVYILSVGATAGSATLRLGAGVSSNTTGTVTLVLPQLELGSTATGYMPSGATNGFRAVPVVSGSAAPRGLLIEEQRTNLLTYSEMFADAAWVKTASSIAANTIVSPDGTVTGDKLVEDTSNASHLITRAASVTSGAAYTFTIFAKSAERSIIRIAFGISFPAVGCTVSLADGSVSDGTASVQSVGNGWWRISLTSTAIATGSAEIYLAPRITTGGGTSAYQGNGTSGIYLWGAQLEAGAFATSYIPTVASTVTRSADVATINTLSPWYNATEGTLFVEVGELQSGGRAITLSDGTSSNQILIGQSSSGVYASSWQAQFVSAYNSGKAALAFKQNSFAFSINGTLIGSDNSGNMANVDRLRFGGIISEYPNGTIKKIAYYPRALSTAELQALTA